MKISPLVYPLTIIAIAVIAFGGYRYYLLSKTLATTTAQVETLASTLASTTKEKENLLSELGQYQNISDSFAGQIASITNKVIDYAKINNTDPQFLQKYSKIFFLNENYIPQELTLIDPRYTFNKKEEYFHKRILPFLSRMIDDASQAKMKLQILSAYRSFETQSTLKSTYKVTYGAGTANQFSADQGYSEHQLGTATDLTTPTIGSALNSFSKTNEYKWLTENAYKYGFILSYPANNTYYQFEPWHWRFVGVALATTLHNTQKYFYDLDQREINKYIVNFFDTN